METNSIQPVTPGARGAVTAKDFFMWAGAMIALYWTIVSFLILLFEYIDRAFPDIVTYSYFDPYSGSIRFAMASLIVLGPLTVVLLRFIRRDIEADSTKAEIWVRRWALMLTIFVAGVTVAIDLITLINTFLGGELTTRFVLKVLVVLLVAAAGFMHFYADLKGYWRTYPSRAKTVGYAFGAVAILTVISGFFIIGSPMDIRLIRLDDRKQNDLSNLQWQIVNYWQQKEVLPASLNDLSDEISGQMIPLDPQSGASYGYSVTGPLSFKLCAVFNRESTTASEPSMAYPAIKTGVDESWKHGIGETCFDRTIDPARYPPFTRPVR